MDSTETTKTTRRDAQNNVLSEETTVRTFVEDREGGQNKAFREAKHKLEALQKENAEREAKNQAADAKNANLCGPAVCTKLPGLSERIAQALGASEDLASRRQMLHELQRLIDRLTHQDPTIHRLLYLIDEFTFGPR